MRHALWAAGFAAGLSTLLGTAAVAQARGADCARAASAVDKAICSDPALKTLDQDTGRLFAVVRDGATPPVRRGLLAQQHAWLVRRDAVCARGDAGCLTPLYQRHRDWLQALSNRISPGAPLSDLQAVALQGRWSVGDLLDPAGAGKAPLADVAKTLALAGLPNRGETVTGKGAQVCYSDGCTPFGFDPHPLKWLPDGAQPGRRLHLAADTPAFVQLLEGKSSFTAIRRGDGRLLMDVTVCAANARDCRGAYQVWSPASPDARLGPIAP